MSNQALHIAAEVLIIGGIAVYFNKQAVAFNTKLEEAMTLIKSLQDSNEKLNKHVNSLYELIESMGESADPFANKAQKGRAQSDNKVRDRTLSSELRDPVQGIRKRNPGIVKRQMPVDDDYSLDFDSHPQGSRNYSRGYASADESRPSSRGYASADRDSRGSSSGLRQETALLQGEQGSRNFFNRPEETSREQQSASVFSIPMQMMMSMATTAPSVPQQSELGDLSPKVEIVENDEDDELKEELAMLNSAETCPIETKIETKIEIIDI